MTDSAVLMTVSEDELDVLVSIAIRRAEILTEAKSPLAREAWREVMIYERRLAELTPANNTSGCIARLGAVTAALSAHDYEEAARLGSQYSSDPALPPERKAVISRTLERLQNAPTVRAINSMAAERRHPDDLRSTTAALNDVTRTFKQEPLDKHITMTPQQQMSRPLLDVDPDVFHLIQKEVERQHSGIELIASENFTSEAIMEATASVYTNKYAEGYPGKRYYGGCEHTTDVLETLARDRAKKLFNAEYANVQPHSGSQANAAVYGALLTPGDTILGLDLNHGGHLTHGNPHNFSGRYYHVVPYHVRQEDERIDYDELLRLAVEHKPKMIIAGGSAYARIIDFKKFREAADACGAVLVVDMAHFSGLVAAGLYPNPCEFADIVTTTTHKTLRGPRSGLILAKEKFGPAIDKNLFPGIQGGPLVHVIAAKAVCFLEAMQPDFVEYQKQVILNAQALAKGMTGAGYRVVSGGTDTHVMLVDVFSKGLKGKEAERSLDEAWITVNKNTIPFDINKPFNPSGIRLGSPAVTTRGFGVAEMGEVACMIADVLANHTSADAIEAVRKRVKALTQRFPLYAWKLAPALTSK